MSKLLTIPLLVCYLVSAVVPAGFCYMSGLGVPCCPNQQEAAPKVVEEEQMECSCCQERSRASGDVAPTAVSAEPHSGDCHDRGCCAEAHHAVLDRATPAQETLAVAAVWLAPLELERPVQPVRSRQPLAGEALTEPPRAWADVPLYVQLESYLL